MNRELIESLNIIEKEKGISSEIIIEAIESALVNFYRKNVEENSEVRAVVNRETGDIRILAMKTVSEESGWEDVLNPVSLEEARKIDKDIEIGDKIEMDVTPHDFGRKAAQNTKQSIIQKIREAERNIMFDEYNSRVNEIITGTVQRKEKYLSGREAGDDRGRNGAYIIYVDLGKAEAVIPPNEQIPGERYEQNSRIKAYLVSVNNKGKEPQIKLSRTHPGLLKSLLDLEVPEIHDGTVEIKSIAREAGSRSKISVYSNDPNVDPLGACVGSKGSRIQAVVDELNGEKIDVVNWSEDIGVHISNALSPANITDVIVDEETKKAQVIVPDNQLSLAIGKAGQNARLAAKLTNWKIDIKSESQYDAANEEPEEEIFDILEEE